MSERDQSHTSDFEVDTRERLATLETRQETIQSKVEEVRDGQQEVIDTISDLGESFVTEEQLREIENETQENTISRERKQAIIQFVLTLVSVAGALGGYIVFIA